MSPPSLAQVRAALIACAAGLLLQGAARVAAAQSVRALPRAPPTIVEVPALAPLSQIGPAPTASGALSLTLEEALARGETYVPQLVRARNDLLRAQARRPGAAVILPINPYASLLVGRRSEQQPSGAPATGVQLQAHLEQQIEVAGQRWARLRVVEAAVAAAQAGTDFARIATQALVRTVYIQAVLADRRVTVSQNRAQIGQQLLSSATDRARLGASGDIEVNLASVEIGRVIGDVVDAQVERESRLAELRMLTGLAQTTPLQLASQVNEPPLLRAGERTLDDVLRLAEAHRADLRALRQNQRELRAERSRYRREAVPSPILSFDFQRDLPGQHFYGGTIGLPLPVWNRNQAPLAQVHAATVTLRAEEQLLVLRIHGQVSQAFRTLQLRRSQAQQYRDMVLPPAERNVELLRRGWQAGKFDLFRVIAASRELSETRLRYLNILEDLWGAAIDLERAVGASLLIGADQ